MPRPETNTRKIVARLKREGWTSAGGAKHDKFVHPDRAGQGDLGAAPHNADARRCAQHRKGRRLEVKEFEMRYVALVDGKPGAYGVAFPDCPGCTAMGGTVEEALINAIEALADWAEDADPMPEPSSVAKLRRDPEVKAALADGDALALVPLVRDAGRAVKANLSLDAGLLEAIDEAAESRGLTRSAFITSAAREKIRTEG